jgi:hypothetical protein
MATFEWNQQLTLVEIAKRIDPEGDTMRVAEVLERTNALLKDLPFKMANDRTTHVSSLRVSQPAGKTRRYNQGVLPSASSVGKNRDVIELLEDWSDIDERLIATSGDIGGQRSLEATAFLEGMGQTIASRFIYGNNATDEDQMTGFFPRLATIDNEFVRDNGGTGSDLSSLLIVQPGITTIYGIFPQGETAGIERKDWGLRVKETTTGSRLAVWSEQFKAGFGLAVEDPRCMARIANIENTGASNTFDFEEVIDAKSAMKNGGEGAIIYANRRIMAQIKKAALNKQNVNLTMDNVFGDGMMPVIDGSPVRLMEALTLTESAVT